MNTGFVICSRLNSRRIPNKPLQLVDGVPLIEHLISRLVKTEIMVYLAVPKDDFHSYMSIKNKYGSKVILFEGDAEDPLSRMQACAEKYDLDTVLRICHDKIFIDPDTVYYALDQLRKFDLDYVYSNEFTDGSAFEVISRRALDNAAFHFKGVEHISYAIRAVTKQQRCIEIPEILQSGHRLLVDYPEDLDMMEVVLQTLGHDVSLEKVIQFLGKNVWMSGINHLPTMTIYTCAYNAAEWIQEAMDSVVRQINFHHYEYVLIDDHSTDHTPYLMARMATKYPNVRWMRNPKNVGLATSSNRALNESKGDYIMRLDADDYFMGADAAISMLAALTDSDHDVIYPNNYYGRIGVVQPGREEHHIGGAIFNRKAVNHVRFTDGLRGLEGFDFWARAKDQLSIGYLNKPTFFYRQHDESLSKNHLDDRAKIRKNIEDAHGLYT